MLKRILLAVVVLSFCSTSAVGQDEQVFVTFGQGADVSATSELGSDSVGTSGSAFVYSAGDFAFNAFDLDFSTSASDVIQFTGLEVFNSISRIGQFRWDGECSCIDIPLNPTDGRLIGVAVLATGVSPIHAAAGLDPDFDTEAGFFQLARIDYDIVGRGTADITLAVGANQFFDVANPTELITPSLGNGTLVVGVPEPSTVGLLGLGLVGFVGRRRR